MRRYLPTPHRFPQGFIGTGTADLALDRDGEAIYAGLAVPHPEAAVHPSRPEFVVALLLALSGCHLLDQTDFAPPRPAPPPPPPIVDPETRTALVTIDYVKANPDYETALTNAIRTVETRRPGMLYDVVAVVADASGAPTGRNRAADVMTTIEAAGVNPARIQLGLKLDPGRKIAQVRVYLR